MLIAVFIMGEQSSWCDPISICTCSRRIYPWQNCRSNRRPLYEACKRFVCACCVFYGGVESSHGNKHRCLLFQFSNFKKKKYHLVFAADMTHQHSLHHHDYIYINRIQTHRGSPGKAHCLVCSWCTRSAPMKAGWLYG